MDFGDIVGQTLDDKYRIEKELGRGGMGAVYLATHIGTERPVAVKVIVPEFMRRTEFVERFRREARAAGRLRHPNVVDVTDFGIAETEGGDLAYLVMEYLDGCTLGEILEEEKHLPVSWTVDILEQVCSAVQEAHHQGIIHRDLKPDNIWLEPNQRGGYTVKVLDFGIAKLETPDSVNHSKLPNNIHSTAGRTSKKTIVDAGNVSLTLATNQDSTAMFDAETIADKSGKTSVVHLEGKKIAQSDESGTLILNLEEPKTLLQQTDEAKNPNAAEAGTLIQNPESGAENKTAIFSASDEEEMFSDDKSDSIPRINEAGTQIMTEPAFVNEEAKKNSPAEETVAAKGKNQAKTQELTRIGAVLGTPLYMSPEQCRGEHLTPQSDIYSLAVIAYQMLGGKLPFEGNFTEVMNAHKTSEPPPLEAKKVSKRLKKTVMCAMSKDPKDRPKDAEAFATVLRAQSEGIGSIYRQSITLYGKNLTKFLLISAVLFLPITSLSIVPMILKIFQYFGMTKDLWLDVVGNISAVLAVFAGFLFGSISLGMITLLVTRHLSAPLRPLDIKSTFDTVRQKWKTLFGLASLTAILTILSPLTGAVLLVLIAFILQFLNVANWAIAIISLLGVFFLCVFPLLIVASRFALLTPAIVMENLRGRAALRRSNELSKRAPWTIMGLTAANFILPMLLSSIIMVFIVSVIGNVLSDNAFLRGMGSRPTLETQIKNKEKKDNQKSNEKTEGTNIQIGANGKTTPGITINTTESEDDASNSAEDKEEIPENEKYARAAGGALRDLLFQILWFPLAIIITSFAQVLMALLYVRTRQAGGEPMRDLLTQFEDDEKPKSRWQKRIQKRLMQSGRIAGRTSRI